MKKENRNYKNKAKYFCVAFGFVIPSFFLLLFGPVPVQAASLGDMVINEILYDPHPDAPEGDANYDGTRDASEDEFVEIVNMTEGEIDMESWTLSDGLQVRHTFPSGTIIEAGYAIVIFGGGSPDDMVWNNTTVQTASTTSLLLNNNGDTVTLRDESSTLIWDYTYLTGAANDESLQLWPELSTTSGTMVPHSTRHLDGDLFSPGFGLNGEEFPTSPVVPIPGAVWLLGSGLIGVLGFRRKFRKK